MGEFQGGTTNVTRYDCPSRAKRYKENEILLLGEKSKTDTSLRFLKI